MLYQLFFAATLCAAGVSAKTNLASSSPETLKQLFDNFKREHSRHYSTMDEEKHRFGVFVNFLRMVDERNAANDGSVHGITRFADLSQEEFEAMYLDRSIAKKMRSRNATKVSVKPYVGGAQKADWVGTQTTAIKDQANCGSCWAHAAAEQIESDGMRLLGNPASLELSVQQLVSCDHGEDQNGCMGGLQETAFDYVRENGGIVTAADYPYTARTGRCDSSINNYVMGVTGYSFMIEDDVKDTEAVFTTHVLNEGTISIGADATTWNTYKSGIMVDCGKGTDINHSVQIVGVNTATDGTGYWKIRNSWTADWGEDGYLRVAYGANTCGLATEGASYTTVYNI